LSYKDETIANYNAHAELYCERNEDYIESFLKDDVEIFLSRLRGNRILDLGCGPGRDMSYFKGKGFQTIGIDLADNMLKICRRRGLDAAKMDFECMGFKPESFDGVWAYLSVLRLIPKNRTVPVLREIRQVLKSSGIAYFGTIEGTYEGMMEDALYPRTRRWTSEYAEDEMREMLLSIFRVEYFSRVVTPRDSKPISYIHFLCTK